MTLRELEEKLDVPHKVALRLAPMIPGAKKEAAGPGQIPGWGFPDDAPDHVTEEMLQAARASLRDDPARPAELREESRGVREAREASELADARRRQIEAEEELAGTERRRKARQDQEEVERRRQRLRLRELADTRSALVDQIRDLEQRLAALRREFAALYREFVALKQEVAMTDTHLETLLGLVEAEEQAAAGARARREEVEAELAGAQAELAAMVADLHTAQEAAAVLKGDCDRYVAAARAGVAAIEAQEADWRAATRALAGLWRGPVTGQALRGLTTLIGTLAGTGTLTVTEEAAALAELRRRLLRVLLPEGVGELQAAMEEIAGLMNRRDLSNEQRTAQVSGLARKALARILEQQRGKGNSTG